MSPLSTRFRFRRFVTSTLLVTSVLAAVSGVVLFLRPEGSLARWTDWSVVGLDKKQWEAVHLVFVAVAVVAGLLHIWLNGKAVVAAVLRAVPAGLRLITAEFVAACAVAAVVWWTAVEPWGPSAALVELRSAVKDGRMAARVLPPVADADRLAVRDLCRLLELEEARVIASARRRGVEIVDPQATLGAVARSNGISPEDVYVALRGD